MMTTDARGSKFWRNSTGDFHRTDGPAIEWADGSKYWMIGGLHHRTDGPAVVYSDGLTEWCVDGVICGSAKEFKKAAGLTNGQVAELVLKYGEIR